MMEWLAQMVGQRRDGMTRADASYTKACKEMEDALKSKLKAERDPSFIYDLAHQRRVTESLRRTSS